LVAALLATGRRETENWWGGKQLYEELRKALKKGNKISRNDVGRARR
jgi:hypothetical protein